MPVPLNDVFKAIADPTRREILRLLPAAWSLLYYKRLERRGALEA